MKKLLFIVFTLSFWACHASYSYPINFGKKTKKDSLQTHKKPFLNFKKDKRSPVIEKMSDEQLMLLIDHMFEASFMPPDLWSQVMMETAKRNLSKITRDGFQIDQTCYQSVALHIEKLMPDSVAPLADPSMMFLFPASNYYSDNNEEDLTTLYKDEFTFDASYTLELENSEVGCFTMPSWGPLSSPFGWRHKRYHKGVDIQLRKGDTVVCAFGGMVRFAQKKGGYGNVVIVRHYNGLETVYGHLNKINVEEGQVLSSGELIGLAGNTGKSTGPHLHFEVRFKGAPVDPQYFISFDYGRLMFNTVTFKKNKSGLLAAFHPDTEFHTVEKEDTFAGIASRYNTTTTKLRKLNNLSSRQYIRLKAGQVFRVRELENQLESASK